MKIEPSNFEDLKEIAKAIAGAIPGQVTPAAALVACGMVVTAGFSVWQTPSLVSVVSTRPTWNADACRAILIRAGCTIETLHRAADRVSLRVTRPATDTSRESSIVTEWTIDRARKAGLLDRKTSPWLTHPESMLTARCITDAARHVASDLFVGFGGDDDALPTIAEVEVVNRAAVVAHDDEPAVTGPAAGVSRKYSLRDDSQTEAAPVVVQTPAATTPEPSPKEQLRAKLEPLADALKAHPQVAEARAALKVLDDDGRLRVVAAMANATADAQIDTLIAALGIAAPAQETAPAQAELIAAPAAEAPTAEEPAPVEDNEANRAELAEMIIDIVTIVAAKNKAVVDTDKMRAALVKKSTAVLDGWINASEEMDATSLAPHCAKLPGYTPAPVKSSK